jgi:hypothetical protein
MTKQSPPPAVQQTPTTLSSVYNQPSQVSQVQKQSPVPMRLNYAPSGNYGIPHSQKAQ